MHAHARCYGDLSCDNRYEEDADDLDTKKDNVESNELEESYDQVLTREILQTLTNLWQPIETDEDPFINGLDRRSSTLRL